MTEQPENPMLDDIDADPISDSLRSAANAVLVFFGDEGGYGTIGGFTESLIGTIVKADVVNRQHLALGFRDTVRCVNIYNNEPGGVDRLRSWAAGLW